MEITPTLLISSITGTAAVVGVVVRLTNRGEGKRKAIYGRIEQERKDTEEKYQTQKLCDERSGHIESRLDEILKEVKKRNGN